MLETALITFLIGAQIAAQPAPTYHLEREPVNGGAELVTLFERFDPPSSVAENLDVPLLSVLRDTLGNTDPDSTRLRHVWILTSTPPAPLQRAASALSFFWVRTGSKPHADHVPGPLMDLSSPAKTVWTNLLAAGLQSYQLDPLGVPVRASTRSYRGNSSDYRRLQVFRALSALEGLEQQSGGQGFLPAAEFRELYSRLSLSDRTFGGLVQPEKLLAFYDLENSRRAEMQGHNWELLRQRAESFGLYFEPLTLAGGPPTEALLWVARADLDARENRHFDRQFLNIANPWTDDRLLRWTGYAETRYFDGDNRPVPRGTLGARAVELIPLALYSLNHPRVPLLLVDFRSNLTAKRRELLQHGANTMFAGVLGITGFGNWSFLAANSTWTFIRGRHGAPTDRSARLRSYSEAREFLAMNGGLNGELKAELLRRLDQLALNPLENGLETEARIAREQYAALIQYAKSPNGLVAALERDRRRELETYTRSRAVRILARAGRFFEHRSSRDPSAEATVRSELASRRRASSHERYLEQLLASSPRPEVVRDPGEISQVIEALAAETTRDSRASRLIADVLARSGDARVRMACLRSIQRLDLQEAHQRNGDPEPVPSGGAGQF